MKRHVQAGVVADIGSDETAFERNIASEIRFDRQDQVEDLFANFDQAINGQFFDGRIESADFRSRLRGRKGEGGIIPI